MRKIYVNEIVPNDNGSKMGITVWNDTIISLFYSNGILQ